MTNPDEQDRVVIRDNRKIDPVTGEARKASPAAEADPPTPEAGEGPTVDAALLDERTRDLQRLQAEYANYRKRAERDRLAAGDIAVGRTLAELLPVIDDLDRARDHGDLTGPLKAVADKLESVFTKLALEAFGAVGDPFDPAIHEAVLHDESDAVTEPTCTTVMRKGYRHHDRLLRPAMVGVSDPASPAPVPTAAAAGEPPTEPPTESQSEPAPTGEPSDTAARSVEDDGGARDQNQPSEN